MRLLWTALLCAAACVLARPLAACLHQLVGHGLLGEATGAVVDFVFVDLYGPERHDVFFADHYRDGFGYRLAGYFSVIVVALPILLFCRVFFSRKLKLALWAGAGFALCDALVRISVEIFTGLGDMGEVLPWLTEQAIIHYAAGTLFAVLALVSADTWLRHLLISATATSGELRLGKRLGFLGLFVLAVLALQVPAVLVKTPGIDRLFDAPPAEGLTLALRLGIAPLLLLGVGFRQRIAGLPTPLPIGAGVPLALAAVAVGACVATQWFLVAGVRW